MNRITQEALKRQAVVKLAIRKGNSYASRMYGVSLSSVKRWRKRYAGTWQSLKEGSHRPHSHPKRHTSAEETLIRKGMDAALPSVGALVSWRHFARRRYLKLADHEVVKVQ